MADFTCVSRTLISFLRLSILSSISCLHSLTLSKLSPFSSLASSTSLFSSSVLPTMACNAAFVGEFSRHYQCRQFHRFSHASDLIAPISRFISSVSLPSWISCVLWEVPLVANALGPNLTISQYKLGFRKIYLVHGSQVQYSLTLSRQLTYIIQYNVKSNDLSTMVSCI